MPRCWPEEPLFAPGADAERLVWERLRDQLPDEAALFHSLAFYDDGVECEADIVVAWPGAGVAVLEVKGGHVSVEGGRWWQGSGQERHAIDPVGQAQRCRHALHSYLEGRSEWRRGRPRTTHLVATPYRDVPRDAELPDLPRRALLDRSDVEDAASSVLRALQALGHGSAVPDDEDVLVLEEVLAVTLPGQLDLLSEARAQEAHADQLTQDQLKILNMLRYQRRLVITGGAGTGKTFLAMAQARRLAKEGQRVALTCYSRGLATLFQRTVRTWPKREQPAYVGTFHGLGLQWGAPPGQDDDGPYWEERLPALLVELAAAQPESARFDTVVLDEAQDFGESWWPPLTACLRDPVSGGLSVFLDEAQRVFARRGEPPLLPLLDLDENLRNTQRIAQVFGSLAGDRRLRFRGKKGVPVRLVPARPEQAQRRADDAVEALLEEGWPQRDIALLTTHHRHDVHRERLERWGHERYWDSFFDDDEDVFYGHVLGFKGLERPVVVLAVDGFRDAERARELLYVGLSRARALLVVVGDLEVLGQVGGDGVRTRLSRDAERWDVPEG